MCCINAYPADRTSPPSRQVRRDGALNERPNSRPQRGRKTHQRHQFQPPATARKADLGKTAQNEAIRCEKISPEPEALLTATASGLPVAGPLGLWRVRMRSETSTKGSSQPLFARAPQAIQPGPLKACRRRGGAPLFLRISKGAKPCRPLPQFRDIGLKRLEASGLVCRS